MTWVGAGPLTRRAQHRSFAAPCSAPACAAKARISDSWLAALRAWHREQAAMHVQQARGTARSLHTPVAACSRATLFPFARLQERR